MARGTQAAKVGLFVALTGAAAYGIYRYVSPEVSGGGGYTVHAYIQDATGLATRSRVTIAGIPVGTLDSIKLENGEARLNVKVKNDVALYDNAHARQEEHVAPRRVGRRPHAGHARPPQAARRRRDPRHRRRRRRPADLMEEVKEIADSVKAVAQQLAASIGTEQGGKNIKAILQNVADATDALNKTIRENREVIRETLLNVARTSPGTRTPRSRRSSRTSASSPRTCASSWRPPTRRRPGQKGELRDTIEHLDQSSKSLQSALEHIDSVAGPHRPRRGDRRAGSRRTTRSSTRCRASPRA